MSDTEWDFIRDKMAEAREARNMARYDYCYETCDEHNLEHPCPFCNVDEESWDYNECFEVKGGIDE